jgi:hypothetical protein
MAPQILKFTDEKTGAICEIDLVAGRMLSHGRDGQTVETKVEEMGDGEFRSSLSRYASDIDRRMAMASVAAHNKTHLMDLGIADVQQAAPLPNYAAGYRHADGVAEMVSPIVRANQPSAKYYTWDKDDAFQGVDGLEASPGGNVKEISPRVSNSTFTCQQFALSAFVPTEVQAAADAPLRPFQAAIRRVMTGIHIAREVRVQALLGTAGSYATAQKVTVAPGAKWNGGATSDPLSDLHQIIENALMEPTGIVMSRRVYNNFVRNPAVQKFIAFKGNAAPIPDPKAMAALLELPPIFVAKMKRKSPTAGTYDYIWGNDVVLFHNAAEIPADGQDISSSYTFRWTGASAQDGQAQDGMLVRVFFDQNRGPAGGTKVVVSHHDAEILTSALVGGMVVGAYQ